MMIKLGIGLSNALGISATAMILPKPCTVDRASASAMPSFSAHVEVRYGPDGGLASFAVQFLYDDELVYVWDEDLLGIEGTNEEPVFRFFDWKNSVWAQISGKIIREKRIQHGQYWYTQAFTFLIGDDVLGIDYFGLRLKKGMFGFQGQDEGVRVLCAGVKQQMTFDTSYFILNPKDPLRNLIQIRQDSWMPLLVSAYILGSAVERRDRPYFSRAIERICEWFEYTIGQRRGATDAAIWSEPTARRQLVGEMIQELWDKGPRRLVAFYSGIGYVFNTLGLEDIAADVIYDVHVNLSVSQESNSTHTANDVNPRMFATMLLLGLHTEKARLYVSVDLNERSQQESHTWHGIRELIDSRTLMNLFFAPKGKRYAPITIPKPFELHWGRVEYQVGYPQVAQLSVSYKRDTKLQLTMASHTEDQRCSISLTQHSEHGEQEWLGRIILNADQDTGQICFLSESMTSNFRHLRDINAFKYILLIAAVHYTLYVLHANPQQMRFEADFFDHCAPYDLLLLQQCGWEPAAFDLVDYNFDAAKVVLYSGRAMTLPLARIPSRQPYQSSLLVYILGEDGKTVAIDQSLYAAFIAELQQSGGKMLQTQDGSKMLIDGVPHNLASIQRFNSAFTEYLSPFGIADGCES